MKKHLIASFIVLSCLLPATGYSAPYQLIWQDLVVDDSVWLDFVEPKMLPMILKLHSDELKVVVLASPRGGGVVNPALAAVRNLLNVGIDRTIVETYENYYENEFHGLGYGFYLPRFHHIVDIFTGLHKSEERPRDFFDIPMIILTGSAMRRTVLHEYLHYYFDTLRPQFPSMINEEPHSHFCFYTKRFLEIQSEYKSISSFSTTAQYQVFLDYWIYQFRHLIKYTAEEIDVRLIIARYVDNWSKDITGGFSDPQMRRSIEAIEETKKMIQNRVVMFHHKKDEIKLMAQKKVTTELADLIATADALAASIEQKLFATEEALAALDF